MPESAAVPDPERAAEARAALVDGLAHLVDEVALLRGIVGRVPDVVLEGRPREGDRSIKELYALVAALDARVFRPAAEQLAAGADAPAAVPVPDEAALLAECDADGRSIEALLDEVATARAALVGVLRGLSADAWGRTVTVGETVFDGYGLARRAVQATADRLRMAGYRLYESNLTDRPGGLPK